MAASSGMILAVARGYHADTDHPARHDLSLPAAGRLWRAPDDAPPTRHLRSKGARGEPRDQPGAQEPTLRSGRFRQSCRDRPVFGSLKRAVVRKRRAPRAFARGRRRPGHRGRPRRFPSNIAPMRCRTSHTASNAVNPIRGTRSAAGLVNSCPQADQLGLSSFSAGFSKGINHGFRYRRREAKGIQQPVETLRLGHGSCRDFAMLMIEAARSLGFAARFASGYLAIPNGNPEEPASGSARGATHAWAQVYVPAAGWIGFDPTRGSAGILV